MTLHQAIETAKAKAANSPEWLRAIEKAGSMLQSGELCVTLFADNTALVTSPNGSYRVNGQCPCAARTSHCYHRAGKRLVELAEEMARAEEAARRCDKIIEDIKRIAAADDRASCGYAGRAQVIADIKRMWPATWPPLGVELMARFRKNQLEMLDDDMLRRVRMAVAL